MAPPASSGRIDCSTVRSSPTGARVFLMKVSIIHLWAASRPVSMTPLRRTGSPTVSSRMTSGESGNVRLCTVASYPDPAGEGRGA